MFLLSNRFFFGSLITYSVPGGKVPICHRDRVKTEDYRFWKSFLLPLSIYNFMLRGSTSMIYKYKTEVL